VGAIFSDGPVGLSKGRDRGGQTDASWLSQVFCYNWLTSQIFIASSFPKNVFPVGKYILINYSQKVDFFSLLQNLEGKIPCGYF
jgi:hypothetical protein